MNTLRPYDRFADHVLRGYAYRQLRRDGACTSQREPEHVLLFEELAVHGNQEAGYERSSQSR